MSADRHRAGGGLRRGGRCRVDLLLNDSGGEERLCCGGGRETKAIVSSGYSSVPMMIDFEKYGFKGAIAKPYEAIELSIVLHEVIAGKKSA